MLASRATILSRQQTLSPTVTAIRLRLITQEEFNFLPGQWVDFKPLPSSTWKDNDGLKNIGGYSITSIPQSLPLIDLAIQSSHHPVAEWITNHAQPNDIVNVRVGGTFTYSSHCLTAPKTSDVHQSNKLLFIAGDVGINPLFSMVQQWHADQQQATNDSRKSRAIMLYSSKAIEYLLFLEQLHNVVEEDSSGLFKVICTTTTTKGNRTLEAHQRGESNITFREGRIDLKTSA